MAGTLSLAYTHLRRILVVDDNHSIHESLGAYLGELLPEARTDFAFDHGEVFERLEQERYDLMLLDISMPGRTGLDILPEIMDACPSLLVIMVTSYENLPNLRAALRGGAIDFLSKPCTLDDLEDALRLADRHLQRRASFLDAQLQELERLYENIVLRRSQDHRFQRFLHDFSSSLAACQLNLEYLRKNLSQAEDRLRKPAQETLRAFERVQDFINDFQGNRIGRVQAVEVRRVIDDILTVFRTLNTIKAENVRIAVEHGAQVTIPELSLFRIMFNLLKNAVEHAQSSNLFIEISLRKVPYPPSYRWRSGTPPNGKFWMLRVADNGKGIPDDRIARIFQHQESEKGPSGGSGLHIAVEEARVCGVFLYLVDSRDGCHFALLIPEE